MSKTAQATAAAPAREQIPRVASLHVDPERIARMGAMSPTQRLQAAQTGQLTLGETESGAARTGSRAGAGRAARALASLRLAAATRARRACAAGRHGVGRRPVRAALGPRACGPEGQGDEGRAGRCGSAQHARAPGSLERAHRLIQRHGLPGGEVRAALRGGRLVLVGPGLIVCRRVTKRADHRSARSSSTRSASAACCSESASTRSRNFSLAVIATETVAPTTRPTRPTGASASLPTGSRLRSGGL